MKILAFSEGPNPKRGGMGIVSVEQQCKAFSARGHDVLLHTGDITLRSSLPTHPNEMPSREEAGTPILHFKECRHRAFGDWQFAPGMSVYLPQRARYVDAIFLHSLYSYPVLAGYLAARLHHVPYLLWPKGVLAPFQRSMNRSRKYVYDMVIGRRILDNASAIVFSADGEREETRPLNLTAPSVVIPLGFDPTPYDHLPPRGPFRTRYFGNHTGPLILFLGRLNAKKGLDILAAAVARVAQRIPDVRLAVVGAGDPPQFTDRVHSWLEEYGITDRTVLTGRLTGQDKLAALADADVFALPSQAENFGFAVFEAMACRVPVVIADTLNYAAEVQRRFAGQVVRRDPDEFAKGIVEVLTDPQYRERLAKHGLQMISAYTWEKSSELLERTLKCILQRVPLPTDLTGGL